ncbi:unnamed protein product [Rotaria socialis]|uniref:Uncharacterized protein n=1 Tax=Rotaria socialis TaxID=392032 RepID=A0A821HLE8_9BILA|nr:unnamed protein product [Rotaria socialis]
MHETSGSGYAFDCLQYRDGSPQNSVSGPTSQYEMIRYCRSSTMKSMENLLSIKNTTIFSDKSFTFDQLRLMNISSDQLLKWYAPIDLIEEYESGYATGSFFNCSDDKNFWFGTYCQYTFDLDYTIPDIRFYRSGARQEVSDDLLSITNGTCYVVNNDECKSVICLDWREICDGKMDCTNGFDERHCHELEMNNCDPSTGYRCSNGQCIDKEFYLDHDDQCTDSSDEISYSSLNICNHFHSGYGCEDISCLPLMFSCGDGTCYDGPTLGHDRSCLTRRDRLYLQQMPPSTLILFTHIHIIYNDTKPEWICYNETLCPYFVKQKSDNAKDIKRLTRSCSLLPWDEPKINCSLFRCSDGTKCISYHRLSDGHEDCLNGEDEHQQNICSFNLLDRFKCDNNKQCIPVWLLFDSKAHCVDGDDEHLCDGILSWIPDTNSDTDKSHCPMNEWPCVTTNSVCNNLWDCPDRSDELRDCRGFSYRHCNGTSHFCLDTRTGHPTCLPKEQAGNGIINCVGSIDEPQFCRMKYAEQPEHRFRCRNSDICITRDQTCDCHQDCPENDDEETACEWINNGRATYCYGKQFRRRNGKIVSGTSY